MINKKNKPAGTVAIIIPAYNEELTIKEVITDFYREMKDAFICVVDNNSKDSTGDIALKTIKALKCNGTVLFEKRQGKANAVRKAFTEIEADYYVMVDADCTYPASSLRKLLQPVIDKEADMCIGDRLTGGDYFRENKRPFHNFGNRIVLGLINLLFKSDLNDILTGYRVFSRRFVKNYPILCEGFELETEMTLHALDKKFNVVELPIEYKDRIEGSFSKLNTFRDGYRVLKMIFGIFKDYRPMLFFGIISSIFFLAGIAAGLPVIIEFARTRFITHVPLAVLATGCMICTLIFFSVGLVLDTIVHHLRFMYIQNLINSTDR